MKINFKDWDEYNDEYSKCINDPVINYSFIIYRDNLCFVINKSYNGIMPEDILEIWNIDKKNPKLSCYIRFSKVQLWNYTIPDILYIEKHINKEKFDFLLNLNTPFTEFNKNF